MSAYVLAMYAPPADPAAFDKYYYDTHVPLAKTVPGLKSYTTNKGPIAAAAGASPYYLIAMLEFASMADLQAGLGSPEGAATTADTAHFAQAGLTVLMMDGQLV